MSVHKAALVRYVSDLPPPFRTLPDALRSSSSPQALLAYSDDARHLPLAATLALIPAVYVLGLVSGNVSWVDRIWTSWPVLCSGSVLAWVVVNEGGNAYGACIPRLVVVLCLQAIWSVRLTCHTARRGLYELNSEDYRYTQVRRLLPSPLFQLIHLLVVAVAQPLLLFSLSLPVAALLQPVSLLPAHGLAIPFSTISWLLPARFNVTPPDTPVLHAGDLVLTLAALLVLAIERASDNAMYAFQSAKHADMDAAAAAKAASARNSLPQRTPSPVPVPSAFYPGFPTRGLHAYSRHPNFASEQTFWAILGLFAVIGSGAVPEMLAPAFALSILFCASTALTEWITTRKYPVYRTYSRLVGQFLPQETMLKWLWTAVRGTWPALEREVYGGGTRR